jgi:hypothetical protein
MGRMNIGRALGVCFRHLCVFEEHVKNIVAAKKLISHDK